MIVSILGKEHTSPSTASCCRMDCYGAHQMDRLICKIHVKGPYLPCLACMRGYSTSSAQPCRRIIPGCRVAHTHQSKRCEDVTLRTALLPEGTQGPPQGTKPVPMHSCCTHHGCPAGAAWVLSVLVHHLCTLQHSPAPTALAMGARMGRLLGSPPCTRAHLAAPVNIAWA